MNIFKRMVEIRSRKFEIRKLLENDSKADLDALEKELRSLNEEYENLEERQKTIEGINTGSIPTNPISNPLETDERDSPEKQKAEYRSAFF